MIVVNKRYYDYDYDNNTIIMFDAEDVGLTLDFDLNETLNSNDLQNNKQSPSKSTATNTTNTQNSQSNNPNTPNIGSSQLQSQSTETVPDDIIDPTKDSNATPTLSANNLDEIKEKEPTLPTKDSLLSDDDDKEKEDGTDNTRSGKGNISWISSSSPKGLRKIPYALQVAHSYTISKLEVQLTTLVDTRTILKQQQEQARKLALAARAQQEAYYKQQQHAEYMARHHHQRQYPYGHGHGHGHPPAHPHPGHGHSRHPHPPHPHHGPHPPPPPHGHHPGYPGPRPGPHPHPPHPHGHPQYVHPHQHRHYPHGRHPGYPVHPHAGYRKQEAPKSPSGSRGYYASGHRQATNQYMTYNTNQNHAAQQQNKSK